MLISIQQADISVVVFFTIRKNGTFASIEYPCRIEGKDYLVPLLHVNAVSDSDFYWEMHRFQSSENDFFRKESAVYTVFCDSFERHRLILREQLCFYGVPGKYQFVFAVK